MKVPNFFTPFLVNDLLKGVKTLDKIKSCCIFAVELTKPTVIMGVCSFEVAKELVSAGHLFEDTEVGDFWYDEYGMLWLVVKIEYERHFFVDYTIIHLYNDEFKVFDLNRNETLYKKGFVYAANFLDIIRISAMPDDVLDFPTVNFFLFDGLVDGKVAEQHAKIETFVDLNTVFDKTNTPSSFIDEYWEQIKIVTAKARDDLKNWKEEKNTSCKRQKK